MIYAFILTMLLTGIDIYQTNIILAMGGYEKNKIIKFFMERLGKWWWIPKCLITVIAGVVILYFDVELWMWTICTVQAFVVGWNVRTYIKQSNNQQKKEEKVSNAD